MKHAVVKIEIRISDYEFIIDNLLSTEGDIYTEADELARTYYEDIDYNDESEEIIKYGEKWEGFDEDCYFFFGGEIRTKLERVIEINENEYNILKKYI